MALYRLLWAPGNSPAMAILGPLDGVEKLERMMLDWFCVLAWKIWSSRNSAIMKGKRTKAILILQRAEAFFQDWQQEEQHVSTVEGRPNNEVRWFCPPTDHVKINFDGA